MTKRFNSLWDKVPFVPQTLEAHISLIPKPGKDSSSCANYRPISMIGVDLKIYPRVLADKLQPLMPGLIHLDQVGFVRG